MACFLGVAAVVALLVPRHLWRYPIGGLVAIQLRLFPGRRRELERGLAARAGCPVDGRSASIIRGHDQYKYERVLLILRSFLRPDWRPALRLEGGGHIDEVLQEGRGAILWIGPFVLAPIAAKQALAAHGYRVSHLSRSSHGFVNSRLASMTINRLWTTVEERVLHERIVLSPGKETQGFKRLHQCLRANRLVSIAATPLGRRACRVPLLGGTLTVATGVPGLALATGAPVLPVITIEEDGCYRTIVMERLRHPQTRSREDAFLQMTREFALRLEPFVEAYPAQRD